MLRNDFVKGGALGCGWRGERANNVVSTLIRSWGYPVIFGYAWLPTRATMTRWTICNRMLSMFWWDNGRFTVSGEGMLVRWCRTQSWHSHRQGDGVAPDSPSEFSGSDQETGVLWEDALPCTLGVTGLHCWICTDYCVQACWMPRGCGFKFRLVATSVFAVSDGEGAWLIWLRLASLDVSLRKWCKKQSWDRD